MRSISTTDHVQVWGTDASGGDFVVGVISIDRSQSPWLYMAGAGGEQAEFPNEPAAAAWLARRATAYPQSVFIGRRLTIDYSDWVTNQPSAHDAGLASLRFR